MNDTKKVIFILIAVVMFLITIYGATAFDTSKATQYFTFDTSDISGTKIIDDAGNINGSIIGTGYTLQNSSCVLGECIQLTATSYLNFTPNTIGQSDGFSLIAWMKTTSVADQNWWQQGSNNGLNMQFWNAGTQFPFHTVDSGGLDDMYFYKENTYFPTGQWQLVSFTYNSTTNEKKFYRNQTLNETSTEDTLTTIASSVDAYPFSFGLSANSALAWLDEISIWNRTLSADEINSLWNGGLGYNPFGPQPPNSSVTISPSAINYTQQLACLVIPDSPGGLDVNISITWWQNLTNGTVNHITADDVSIANATKGSTYNLTFNQTYDVREEIWCEVTSVSPGPLATNHTNSTKLSWHDLNPSVISINISNTPPIVSTDVLDIAFEAYEPNLQNVNITTYWYTSTDNSTWILHGTDNESWTDQSNATYTGSVYHTTATGDLEVADTTAWEYWMASIILEDASGNITYGNSTPVQITNTPTNLNYSTSGTTNATPALNNSAVWFRAYGNDSEGDNVKLKICGGGADNWTNCTLLCEDSSGVNFSTTTDSEINCSFTANVTTRNNTFIAILFDGGNYTTSSVGNFYVNFKPKLDTFNMIDTTGDTTYYFGEYIDYFRINQNDSYDGYGLSPRIWVWDPDGVTIINNGSMTNITANTYQYGTDTYLNAIGDYTLEINVTDNDGATTNYTTTFTVTNVNLTSTGRIYGYDFEGLPAYSYINETIGNYSYYLVELRINTSTTWSTISTIIQQMKNESQITILTLEDDISNISKTKDYISTNYNDLIDGNHLNAIRHLKLYVTNTTALPTDVNNITKNIFQNTSNKFPIYVRGYINASLDTNYATQDSTFYLNPQNATEFIESEIGYLRNSTEKTRIYYNQTQALKLKAKNWQANIIDNFRDAILLTNYTSGNIAELDNNDIIVVNNQSGTVEYNLTIHPHLSGYDIYNSNTQSIIERWTDTNFSVSVGANDGVLLYITNLSRIEVQSDNDTFLHYQDSNPYPATLDLAGDSSNAFLFVSSSANPDDARLMVMDPTHDDMDFYVWYGQDGAEAIQNWTRYDIVILGDETNVTWVSGIANTTEMYGYISVGDYGNDNTPLGCTVGVNCTTWNRTVWLNNTKEEVLNWTTIDDEVNIFYDGLDIGSVNDVDNLFGDSLTELVDYAEVSLLRNVTLNTYTNYEDYANLGKYTMRESACGRWNGSVSSPTFEYESITLDVTRANFHKIHGITVLAQAFGNITDYEKSYYCYMQNKVLYGDLMKYSYNQPAFDYTGASDDFQWNYYKYPDLGVALQDDYTLTGDVYSRKFANGIVYVNSTSHTVEYDDGIEVTQMEFCAYYYDNDDGVSDEGKMTYIINDNYPLNSTNGFQVNDSDLTQGVKTWKCHNMSTDIYEPSGWYEMEWYYLDNDANYLNNQGFYMYHGNAGAVGDRWSYWDMTLNGHPSNDETDYTYYSTGDNWAVNFTWGSGLQKGRQLDDLTSVITRTETTDENIVVNFNSSTHWNISVYDKLLFANLTKFNGIKSTSGDWLNYSNSSDCITNNPTYANTVLSGDVDNGTWQACIWDDDTGTQGYYVRVVLPHLSSQNYTIDGNSIPTLENETVTLLNLSENNQSWSFYWDCNDVDGDNITGCYVNGSSRLWSANANGTTCNVTVNLELNSTSNISVYLYAIDEHGDNSTNGSNYTLGRIVYDKIDSSPTVGNITAQYFRKYWNITQNLGNYTDISWDYEDNTARDINLTVGTTRDYLEYETNLIIIEANYSYTADANGTYTVNAGEEMYRKFNITANLTTEETVPSFNFTLPMVQYASGTQSVTTNCSGLADTYSNFSSGSTFTVYNFGIANGTIECYQYIYQGKVVYSDSNVSYSDSGSTRNYYFNNSNGNGTTYGRRIQFLFDDLKSNNTKLYDILSYSTLTNWASKTASAQQSFRWDGSTFTQETSGVDYSYTDNVGSTQVEFLWNPLTSPVEEMFLNLTWSATIATYQCNDGVDNDGDGYTDYPNDPDCTSATDNTEAGAGAGGGGGGGEVEVDLGKVLCDLEIKPAKIYLDNDNRLQEMTIKNNEDFSYTPTIEFIDVPGQPSILDELAVSNPIGTVLSGITNTFGIKYRSFLISDTQGSAELILSSTNCKDVSIPIYMNMTASNVIDELFGGDEPIIERIVTAITTPVSENNKVQWMKLWYFIALFGIAGLAFVWKKQFSARGYKNILAKFVIVLVITGAGTTVLVVGVRVILGG